jgi:hypothetical protein
LQPREPAPCRKALDCSGARRRRARTKKGCGQRRSPPSRAMVSGSSRYGSSDGDHSHHRGRRLPRRSTRPAQNQPTREQATLQFASLLPPTKLLLHGGNSRCREILPTAGRIQKGNVARTSPQCYNYRDTPVPTRPRGVSGDPRRAADGFRDVGQLTRAGGGPRGVLETRGASWQERSRQV